MTDHNGVLTMQRLLLAGALGLTMARKAAAILEGDPGSRAQAWPALADGAGPRNPRSPDSAVLRAILDAANECLGHFDDRPPGERWCDALLQLLDLAAFAGDLGAASLAKGRLSQPAEPRSPSRSPTPRLAPIRRPAGPGPSCFCADPPGRLLQEGPGVHERPADRAKAGHPRIHHAVTQR